MKNVELKNSFDHDISIYYEDGESGMFLTNLETTSTIMMNVAIGQRLYATEPEDWERIDYISIQSDIDKYTFSPHEFQRQIGKTHVHLNIDNRKRQHPQVVYFYEKTSYSDLIPVVFRSLTSRDIEIYFDDKKEGLLYALLHPGQVVSTNAYPHHEFFVTAAGNKSDVVVRFVITTDQGIFYITEKEHPPHHLLLEMSQKEIEHNAKYKARVGFPWRHHFGPEGPRPPPVLYMWPAKQIGDVHQVLSTQGYWSCTMVEQNCQSTNPVKLELEVISVKPKVFLIENFLNSFESDELVRIAKPAMFPSEVGFESFPSETRTSRNGWIERQRSSMIDSLYRRAADVVQIDEALLYPQFSAEYIQVVHYKEGQKYDAHHDWGVVGYPECRFLTMLLYLSEPSDIDAGGETSFPKAIQEFGFKVRPKKGSAVLFYNMLEDGNADYLALHGALEVRKGEKWLANFWIWDPKMPPPPTPEEEANLAADAAAREKKAEEQKGEPVAIEKGNEKGQEEEGGAEVVESSNESHQLQNQ